MTEYYFDNLEDAINLGKMIRVLREKQGYNQTEFSEGICDRTFLSKLENGTRKAPSVILLSKICQKLSISIDDLFLLAFGDGDESKSMVIAKVNALLKARNFDEAHNLVNVHLKNSTNSIYKQFYLFTEAVYYLINHDYIRSGVYVEQAINITTTYNGPLYTLIELRSINVFLFLNIVINRNTKKKIVTEAFNNYTYYLFNSNFTDYEIIGHLYLDCCYYYLIERKIDNFYSTFKACEEIFKTFGMYSHLKEGWIYMHIYHTLRKEEDYANIYYNKLKTFSDLFDEDIMNSINRNKEFFEKYAETNDSKLA